MIEPRLTTLNLVGGMKRLLEEMQERGWTTAGDGHVCAECVEDYALAEHIAAHAVEPSCDYCGRSGGEPIAAPVDELVAQVHDGLASEYGDVNDEGVPFESREGGWQAETHDTYDLLWGVLLSERLLADVSGAMADTAWVQRDFWRLRPHEAWRLAWESFRATVMHRHRFLFSRLTADPLDPDDLSPLDTLDAVGGAILDAGLVRTLRTGTVLYRAHTHDADQTLVGAARLGTAPLEFARSSNRMSPAGVPMFYGSDDADTAASEAAQADPGISVVATVGRFELLRDARIVDLAHPPTPPSMFDAARRSQRQPLLFLGGFADDVSRPVTRDGAEHVEYVPTQIVTEYLHDVLNAGDGPPLLGLAYRASRSETHVNYALWISNDEACDIEALDDPAAGPWLVLRGSERRTLP